MLYLVAASCGLAVGVIVWCAGSRWIATSLQWADSRYPELAGTRKLRVVEGVACGALFFACLALAFWIAWRAWSQMK